ncbi:MAG TPA: HXXEE domain-containing protein, partial [Gemmatimonadaceae bacterium]|nr:HXXEE domain-containing protein [Gemmatimonadaceae bacterium]
MPASFLWLPIAAVAAHLVEEFVWPGGFAEWYRHYPPGATTAVSSGFLVIVNAVFVLLALLPPLLGPSPRGFAIWMVVAAVAGANAVFHLYAVRRTRAYSPGVVTGVLFYLPLAIVG